MKNRFVANLILLVISLSLGFGIGEGVIRYILFHQNSHFLELRNPAYFTPIQRDVHGDLLSDDYWKVNYLMGNGLMIEEVDTLLGWNRGVELNEWIDSYKKEANGKRPVLFFGDSFAQCVKSEICFEDVLNQDTAFNKVYYFMNFGVGGYGTDQIYLLMDYVLSQFENPFVIFSLLTTDIDRTVLKFRDAQKPYFTLINDELILNGVPIKNNAESYLNENPAEVWSYLLNRVKSTRLNPFRDDPERLKQEKNIIKTLNTRIIEEISDRIKQVSKDYLFVLFHPSHHNLTDWRLAFLRTLYERQGVPYICELDIRLADDGPYDFEKYSLPNDGHPTTYLNDLVAKEIKNFVLHGKSNFLRPAAEEFYSDTLPIPKSIYLKYLDRISKP